ncbi:MAG: GGDEF domain-containing protein [Thermoguttaceae bacterium]|nr:GGDEF domain-containing protein [Thermoguttaceae bacterium]
MKCWEWKSVAMDGFAPDSPEVPPDVATQVQRLRAVMDTSLDAILFLDGATGRVIDANPAACEALGYSLDEIASRTVDEIAPRAVPLVRETLRSPGQGAVGRTAFELELRAKSGAEVAVQCRMRVVAEPGGPTVVVVARPLERPGRGRRTSVHRASSSRRGGYDALTGLADRCRFEARLELALREAQREPSRRFAVLFVDLDGFKAINDQFGHLSGDRLLATIAERIARSVRPDDLVARFGGDEFTIFLDDLYSEADAQVVGQRIVTAVAAPVEIDHRTVSVTASIGIAVSWRGYDTPEAMLRDADQAMFQAKRSAAGTCHVAIAP